MKFWQHIVIVASVLSLTACGAELPRRYKSMTMEQRADREPLVRVSAFVIEEPKLSDEPGVLQLSAEGQASLIAAIAKADDSVTGLYQQLAKRFGKPLPSDVIDRSQFTRRIIFSTQKTDLALGLADRISRLEFRLQLKDSAKSLQFQQWNRFKTEHGQIDLGKIGIKKGVELSAKLSPTFGGALNAGEAGVAVSRELSEEITLRQRYITLTGVLDARSATLTQEGVVEIDLTGNTSIDLTVKFAPDALETQEIVKFDSFTTSKGLKAANELSYRLIPIHIPQYSVVDDLKEGVRCFLTGNYIFRHVRKGSKTIIEGDDVVSFIQGGLEATPNEISLMSYEQLKQLRARYFIHRLGSPGENLAIDHPRNENLPLDFATYEEAKDFLDWMNTQNAISVGDRKLKLGLEPLRQIDIVNLRIGIRD